MSLSPVIVTNFKRRITGVTTTANNVTAMQRRLADHEITICGPGQDLRLWRLLLHGFHRPVGRRYRVWHVRRNAEMAWGLFAKQLLRQPIRLVFTSASTRRHSAYPRWLISQMDSVVATSPEAAALVPNVALVQPHGVDVEKFHPGEKTSAPSLVYMGRIRPQKGVHILVDALCQVLPKFPDVQAHLVGQTLAREKNYLAQQQKKVSAAGLDDQVIWHGRVTDATLEGLLAAAHICAVTPLREEFGLTPFEGLAAGCALLVSDAGAFRLALADGETGIMVDPGDGPATAQALRTLLSDDAKRQTMMARARQVACDRFALEGEASALLNLYRQLGDQP